MSSAASAPVTSRRALVLSSCRHASNALVSLVQQLADAHDEVLVAVDEGSSEADLAPLPTRWAAVRQLFREQTRVWVTPLVRAPGLEARGDQLAALVTRVGAVDTMLVDDAALLPTARLLGLPVTLSTPESEHNSSPLAAPSELRRALVVTRAQPFHRGHLALVERALSLADEVVLVVAAAERSHAARDPFTAGERLSLVRAGLGPLMQRCWLVALPSPAWPGMALAQLALVAPPWQLVVAHSPVLRAMALDLGVAVESLHAPFRVAGQPVSASVVRARLVAEGAGAWLDQVLPAACAALLSSSPSLARRCAVIAEADT